MRLDRAHAERQTPGHLLVAEARAEEAQHLRLPGRQAEAVGRLVRHRQGLLRLHEAIRALGQGEQRSREVAGAPWSVPRRRRPPRPAGRADRPAVSAPKTTSVAQVRLPLLQVDEAGDPVREPDLVEEDERDRGAGIGHLQMSLADRVEFRHVFQSCANGRAQVLRFIQDQDANGGYS